MHGATGKPTGRLSARKAQDAEKIFNNLKYTKNENKKN